MKIKQIIKSITPRFILGAWLSYKLRKGWFKRQTTESDNHLEVYWNSREAPNRAKLIEIISSELKSRDSTTPLAVLEYGSHVGINLDILNNLITDSKVYFYAVEPNLDAINFMIKRLPFVDCLHSDDVEFTKNLGYPDRPISLSFINSVFYCMTPGRVQSVLIKLANISNIIVLGEGMENEDGDKSYFVYEPPCYQHPYKKWLNQLGFTQAYSVDAPDPRPQLNKFSVFVRTSNH